MAEFDEEESTPINTTSAGSNKGVTYYGSPQRTMKEMGDDVKSANKLAADYEGDINKHEKKAIDFFTRGLHLASPAAAATRVITVEQCLKQKYPLHYACLGGASLDVIKYLVEEADGDKGKELLGKADTWGMYPLHLACEEGASIDVIKYLVEEADGDKGKELLGKASNNGKYPLHHACQKGASLDVIRYLVEEADGDKGKELLGKADTWGMYPLHLACEKGASIEVIKYLVEEADGDKGKELIGKANEDGRYPLHLACYGGASIDVIKYLVEEADGDKGKELLGKANNDGMYPLHWACQKGASIDVIKYLVEEADGDKGKELLGKANNNGMYPLHWACQKGASIDVIKYLVEEADGDKGKELLGKANNNGMYPLHLACWKGASIKVIKYLIQKNPGSLQYKDNRGVTALAYIKDNNAVKETLLHWVQEFLATKNNQAMSDYPMNDRMDAGEHQDRGDDSAMKEDASNDSEEEEDDDGSSGSDSSAADGVITVEECLKKKYPLHYACWEGASLKVIKYLVEEADGDKGKELLGKVNKNGNYPLHLACWRKDASLKVIKYLVEEADGDKGKEVLGKANKNGRYPLHCACYGGASLDVIKYLVDEADCDKGKEVLGKADNGGMYPLHQACRGGASHDMIKYLVEEADGDKGKEVLGKADQYRKCPLHYACEKGASFNVIKYLVEAGGDKGKEVLCKADQNGKYPLDLLEGASREDVIKYLIQKNPGPLQIKDDSPFINSVKYFFGMECQSTIWNETDEVVYVIVTDRTMATVNTNTTSANIAENTPGGSVGVTHTKKDNKGPTPPQMTPILPRDFHTFNLESKDYYLTYYTKDFASSRNVFHEVNLRMEGKNDYMIKPHCLEHVVEREPRLAWEIFVFSVPVSVSNVDTTTPPAADDDDDDVGQGQGGSSQPGTETPAADDDDVGQGGADSSRGGEGQGEGDDTSGNNNNNGGDNTSGNNNRGDDTSASEGNNNNGGDDTSGNNNRGWSRFKRRVKYKFGMKCKSTIWNETDKVVYVIVTDRTIGITTTTSAKVNPTIFGFTPVDFNHECQHNKGPPPPQMTPIPSHHFRTFNLESKDYYLTYYTKTKLRENGKVFDCLDFHQMNLKVLGKEDYKIYPIDLQITFASVKDEVMSKKAVLGLVIPNHQYQNGAVQPVPMQPVPMGDTRAAKRALKALCCLLLLFMFLYGYWSNTMGTRTVILDEKEL